ncbi:hypothetical protein CHS0354_035230 [Potamilus streckersoni]|uniref:Glycosyltransferase 2-like domain-containing protein n=1 Tax=Potamilus streckersoni TaxID=2493646 RepID=A0AAE0S2Q6_9BIVA|nr:hypothetical protein CHS0354_035230 [Potamilus streckersoni]
MKSDKYSLVVVTPVYEDREASARLFAELEAVFGKSVYIVAVDDGSVRLPLDASVIEQTGLDGVVIKLRRNVGHQRAIAVGLSYVADKAAEIPQVVVMDSDGEDVPATVRELTDSLKDADTDVVVARRKSRTETLRFKAFYVLYKWLFRLMTGRGISFGNFMALKPASVRRLAAMQELWIHLAGTVLVSKLRIKYRYIDRGARYAGESRMNFISLVLHGFKALMVFAEDVLVRVAVASAFIAGCAVLGIITAVVLKLMNYATPGWFSTALGILILLFMQTGALALMTLILTGVVRGGVIQQPSYMDFIDTVFPTGYIFAITVPAVIDRSLSLYILEKLQQRGGGIELAQFEKVFTEEYVKEHRLLDVRLTEQQESGTIVIRNGCVKLTERGQKLASIGRFFRQNILPKKRLLMGEYSDDLTDPFRDSQQNLGYECR